MVNWMPERAWKNEANFQGCFRCEVSSSKPESRRAKQTQSGQTGNCAKRTQFGSGGQLCKMRQTNPIRPRRARRTIAKASGLDDATPGGDKCAKRSQLPRPIVQNEPNFAGRPGPWRAKCAKRSQFPALPSGTRPQGRGARGNRAKRTQFASDRRRRLSPRPEALSLPPRKGQMCKTKPISGGAGRDGASRTGA